MAEIHEALAKAADCIELLAKAHIEAAQVFRTFSKPNSMHPDPIDRKEQEMLFALLESADQYMNTLGDSLNNHDCVDEEIDAMTAPAFELVDRVLKSR